MVLQDFVPHALSQYRSYEDAFVSKIKGQLSSLNYNQYLCLFLLMGFILFGPSDLTKLRLTTLDES